MQHRFQFSIRAMLAATAAVGGVLALWRAPANAYSLAIVLLFVAAMPLAIGLTLFGLKMDYPKIFDELNYSVMCEGTDTLTMAQDNLVCWFGVTMLAGILGILLRHPDTDEEPNKMDRSNFA